MKSGKSKPLVFLSVVTVSLKKNSSFSITPSPR